MSNTTDKDFKVKNGLAVTDGGTFGGPVSVGTPTDSSHAVTLAYLELYGGGGGSASLLISDTEPESPSQGDLWLDTTINKIKFYYDSWNTLANYNDTLLVPEHSHDTSIGGDGLVEDTFLDAGGPGTIAYSSVDGDSVNTNDWDSTYSGGILV